MPNLAHRLYWTLFLATHLIGQGRYPYASPERIARDRDRNVRRMVRYAYHWVPYYRETMDRLGLKPADVQAFDDLRKLPLISVDDLQRAPGAFRSTQFRDEELLELSSSGSTGSPHRAWHDPTSLYLNAAHGERSRLPMQRLIGKGMGYRSVTIDARPGNDRVQAAMRAHALWPHWANLRLTVLDDEQSLDELSTALERLKPDVLWGFGATLGDLYARLDAGGAPFHRPRVIQYAVEAMPDAARRLLMDKYDIQLFSSYQSSEAFKLGWECEAHAGHHINADYYPMRLIDAEGRDVAPGETGEIVMSNLTNRGTVLLNYRTGDLAQRIDEPCPCGRTLPRIGFVVGRTVDALVTPDGRRVPWWLVERAISERPGVWQYQAVQETHKRITLRMLADPACDRAAISEAARRVIAEWMGPEMAVEAAFVDELERTPAGKLRHVINRIRADV